MKQTTYHNSVGIAGDELLKRVQRAGSQKEAILTAFMGKRGHKYTASQMHDAFCNKAGKKWPITSVRRAMSDLMNEGHLVKLDETRPGSYGDPEHYYTLNNRKHPTPTGTVQQSLL